MPPSNCKVQQQVEDHWWLLFHANHYAEFDVGDRRRIIRIGLVRICVEEHQVFQILVLVH